MIDVSELNWCAYFVFAQSAYTTIRPSPRWISRCHWSGKQTASLQPRQKNHSEGCLKALLRRQVNPNRSMCAHTLLGNVRNVGRRAPCKKKKQQMNQLPPFCVNRFHNPSEEPELNRDIVPYLDDNVQLSIEEYRDKLYEVRTLALSNSTHAVVLCLPHFFVTCNILYRA